MTEPRITSRTFTWTGLWCESSHRHLHLRHHHHHTIYNNTIMISIRNGILYGCLAFTSWISASIVVALGSRWLRNHYHSIILIFKSRMKCWLWLSFHQSGDDPCCHDLSLLHGQCNQTWSSNNIELKDISSCLTPFPPIPETQFAAFVSNVKKL